MLRLTSGIRRWVVRPAVTLIVLAAIPVVVEAALEYGEWHEAPARGRLVDVGGGRRLYLNCTGTGSPVVVLAAGLGGGAASWGWIAPEVARETRVCAFDRAGRGWSDPAPKPQDGEGVAQDLGAALTAAGETGPYVLVGHSFGGLYARAFAARYPERVAGVVLLDASDPQMFTRLPAYPGFYKWYRRASVLFPALARVGVTRALGMDPTTQYARSVRDEIAVAPQAMAQAGALVSLGDKPLVIVTAVNGAQEGWTALQDELPKLSTRSAHWSADSLTHQELVDTREGGEISVRAIGEVVAAVRGGGRVE